MLASPLGRLPIARKGASYIRQAKVQLPDRMNTYNLLTQLDPEKMLTSAFRARVAQSEPELRQRATYAESAADSYVNRMLAYDWVYTLAENDLPKVCGATRFAGVAVGYPLLGDELLALSLRVAPNLKVRGMKLRYLFKEALRGFLPDEIITKKKHGFGLPFGVWALRDQKLKAFAIDHLRGIGARGLIEPAFIKSLVDVRLAEHPGYYGELVWILMMLEAWLRERAPAFSLRGD